MYSVHSIRLPVATVWYRLQLKVAEAGAARFGDRRSGQRCRPESELMAGPGVAAPGAVVRPPVTHTHTHPWSAQTMELVGRKLGRVPCWCAGHIRRLP